MAAEGARVVVAARGHGNLESLRREIMDRGGDAVIMVFDCTVAEEATRAVQSAHQAFGGLECVVNVAGIHPSWARIGDQPIESWERVMAVNLSGSFYVCRASLPLLVA